MKREYQNPATGIVNATTSNVIMGSPYTGLEGGGKTGGTGGLNIPARKLYI